MVFTIYFYSHILSSPRCATAREAVLNKVVWAINQLQGAIEEEFGTRSWAVVI